MKTEAILRLYCKKYYSNIMVIPTFNKRIIAKQAIYNTLGFKIFMLSMSLRLLCKNIKKEFKNYFTKSKKGV